MGTVEQVSRFISHQHGELCDACIAARLSLPSRQVHWAAFMLGKTGGYQRVHCRCPRCSSLRWMTLHRG